MRSFLLSVLFVFAVFSARAQPFTHGELAWPDSLKPRAGAGSGSGVPDEFGNGGRITCPSFYLDQFYANGSPPSNFVWEASSSMSGTWTNDNSVQIDTYTWTSGAETFTYTNHDSGGGGSASIPFIPTPLAIGLNGPYWFLNNSPIDPYTDPTNSYSFWASRAGILSGNFTVTASGASQPYRITIVASPHGSGSPITLLQYAFTNTTSSQGFSASVLSATNCFWSVSAAVEIQSSGNWIPGHFGGGSYYSTSVGTF